MVCAYILWSILRSKMNTAWVAVHNNLAILSIDRKAKIRSLKVSDRANIVKVSPLAEISFFSSMYCYSQHVIIFPLSLRYYK